MGKVKILPGPYQCLFFFFFWNIRIIQPETLYLSPDIGSIALIEIEDLQDITVT